MERKKGQCDVKSKTKTFVYSKCSIDMHWVRKTTIYSVDYNEVWKNWNKEFERLRQWATYDMSQRTHVIRPSVE